MSSGPCRVTLFFPYRCITTRTIFCYYCEAVTLASPFIKLMLIIIRGETVSGHPSRSVSNFIENNSVEILTIHSIGADVSRFITLLCPLVKFGLVLTCGEAMPCYPGGIGPFFKQ